MRDLSKFGASRHFDRMRKEVEIVNKLGLHAQPASQFVRCVIGFKSTITICKGEERFSAASILEVLMADLDCGARVVLEAVGPDEQEALNELEALLLRFRDEEGGAQAKLRLAWGIEGRLSRFRQTSSCSGTSDVSASSKNSSLWRILPSA